MVLETLFGAQDLLETRDRNKKNKEMGEKVADTYKRAKAVTAMFHFNEYGCKIGKTALQKKKELQQIQHEKVIAARKKEEAAYVEKKRIYDDVINLQIDDDSKLTCAQLYNLCLT